MLSSDASDALEATVRFTWRDKFSCFKQPEQSTPCDTGKWDWRQLKHRLLDLVCPLVTGSGATSDPENNKPARRYRWKPFCSRHSDKNVWDSHRAGPGALSGQALPKAGGTAYEFAAPQTSSNLGLPENCSLSLAKSERISCWSRACRSFPGYLSRRHRVICAIRPGHAVTYHLGADTSLSQQKSKKTDASAWRQGNAADYPTGRHRELPH